MTIFTKCPNALSFQQSNWTTDWKTTDWPVEAKTNISAQSSVIGYNQELLQSRNNHLEWGAKTGHQAGRDAIFWKEEHQIALCWSDNIDNNTKPITNIICCRVVLLSCHMRKQSVKNTSRCVWSAWARLRSAPSCSPSRRTDPAQGAAGWSAEELPEWASPADGSSPRSFSVRRNWQSRISSLHGGWPSSRKQRHCVRTYFEIVLSLPGVLLRFFHMPRFLSGLQKGTKTGHICRRKAFFFFLNSLYTKSTDCC